MPGIVLGFGDLGMKKTKKSQPSWSLHSVGPTDNRQAKGTEWVRKSRIKEKKIKEQGKRVCIELLGTVDLTRKSHQEEGHLSPSPTGKKVWVHLGKELVQVCADGQDWPGGTYSTLGNRLFLQTHTQRGNLFSTWHHSCIGQGHADGEKIP